jgi:hypothetical protein
MRIDGGFTSGADTSFSNDFTAHGPAGSTSLTGAGPQDGVDHVDGGGVDQIFASEKPPASGPTVSVTCPEGTSPQATIKDQTATVTCEGTDKPRPAKPEPKPEPQPGRKPNPGQAPILE